MFNFIKSKILIFKIKKFVKETSKYVDTGDYESWRLLFEMNNLEDLYWDAYHYALKSRFYKKEDLRLMLKWCRLLTKNMNEFRYEYGFAG